jgi:hypothetical protein
LIDFLLKVNLKSASSKVIPHPRHDNTTTMMNAIDKIMQEMADNAILEKSTPNGDVAADAGLRLLAMLQGRSQLNVRAPAYVDMTKMPAMPGQNKMQMTAMPCIPPRLESPSASSATVVQYDRQRLVDIGASMAERKPPGLAAKLEEFPQIRPQQMEVGGGHTLDKVNKYKAAERTPRTPNIVDTLPLRPNALIFTWDPILQVWVPRSRPNQRSI